MSGRGLRRGALALGLAAALAGCAGVRRIDDLGLGALSRSEVRAATGGLQPVEIAGAPLDGAAAEVVAAALRGPAQVAPTRFRLAAPGEASARLVLQFGRDRPSAAVCARPEGGPPVGGSLVVAASFCPGRGAADERGAEGARPGRAVLARLRRRDGRAPARTLSHGAAGQARVADLSGVSHGAALRRVLPHVARDRAIGDDTPHLACYRDREVKDRATRVIVDWSPAA